MERISAKYKELFPEISEQDGLLQYYTNSDNEYKALIHGVGLRDFPANVIFLSGKDVKDFLHRISTNEINSVEENNHTITLFTNEKGRIIDRTVFLNFGEYFYLIGHKDKVNLLERWIDRYIISEDVNVSNISDKKCVFEVLGPQAESYLTLLCGSCIDSLTFSNIMEVDIEGIRGKVIRTKLNKDIEKFILIVDKESEQKLVEHFVTQKSVFDFSLVGERAYNVFRVENCIPSYPNELNDNFNPHEANVINDVSHTKGCYIGQEVIARLDTYDKVQRELKHFIFIDEFEFNGESYQLENNDGDNLGVITTVVQSPKYNSFVGLGYARRKHVEKLREGKININGKEVRFELKDIGA